MGNVAGEGTGKEKFTKKRPAKKEQRPTSQANSRNIGVKFTTIRAQGVPLRGEKK